jgi:hypothetical protein
MTLEEFIRLLNTYGADFQRWPKELRDAAGSFCRDSDEGRARWEAARALDTLFHLDRERTVDTARNTAVTNAALRRIRVSSERSFDWRWLFSKPLGAAAAGLVLAGWLAGVFLGPSTEPLPERGVYAVSALLGGDAATFEDPL